MWLRGDTTNVQAHSISTGKNGTSMVSVTYQNSKDFTYRVVVGMDPMMSKVRGDPGRGQEYLKPALPWKFSVRTNF